MELLLAGSGPASGFPVPGCGCAACATAGAGALPRRAPVRLELPGGWALGADQESDAAVLAGPGGQVVAPNGQERLAPDGAAPGWEVTAADPGVLVVRLPSGAVLVWAPQAGRLSEAALAAVRGVAIDVLVIGPARKPSWPEVGASIARLRQAGPVTDVVLVGHGHRAGPVERLRSALPHWQARMPLDGERLHLGLPPSVRTPGPLDQSDATPPVMAGSALVHRPRRTLLLGGAASGKSDLAELLLAADPAVRYVATGPKPDPAADADWAHRVRRHRDRRPTWWRTVETDDLATELAAADEPILLDSLGSWLTGVLDRVGAWSDTPGWPDELTRRTDDLVEAWRSRRAPLVAVSDETGLGVVPATSAGRRFRDELGRLNRRLADESESVTFVVAGRSIALDESISPE